MPFYTNIHLMLVFLNQTWMLNITILEECFFYDTSFGSDIQKYYDSSNANVIPTSSEEDRIEKQEYIKTGNHSKYFTPHL